MQVLADDDYGIEGADTASFLLSRAGALDSALTARRTAAWAASIDPAPGRR